MLRRFAVLAAVWVVLLALVFTSSAAGQGSEPEDDDGPAEPAQYGDTELIETLRAYGLLDEWLAASPVSPQASLLMVTGNGAYQAKRLTFLNALDAWADRTEDVRNDLARIDAAQVNVDRLRSVVLRTRDALVLDDRLAPDSTTLAEIEEALDQLANAQVPDPAVTESDASLTQAEARVRDLWERAESELMTLNNATAAVAVSGVQAFVGFDGFERGLSDVDQLLAASRETIRPAQQDSERLASSALSQIPSLHAARMLGSSDVGGLSVVTVDAYIRAAARSSCSVDWALLAGIAQVESNHGRLGGGSVSSSGQVSTTILGPLLDGGELGLRTDDRQLDEDASNAIAEAVDAVRFAVQATLESIWWAAPDRAGPEGELEDDGDLDDQDSEEQGNGFAVVVDSDGGRLDGNDRWDRAVGPMQFLPETWFKWATDGNGDGVSDPNNLYDAAASASRFLCDLSATRGPAPSSFILGYNASSAYVRDVLSAAQGFRSLSLPAA